MDALARLGQPAAGCVSAFLVVCIAEVVLAVLLWTGAPHAAAASYALLPVEAAFWVGFALPFGPVLGMARTVLVLAATRRGRTTPPRLTNQRPQRAPTP